MELKKYDKALDLFVESFECDPHEITELRIAQMQFAIGDFHSIRLPVPSDKLTDGWIRIGILVCALDRRGKESVLAWMNCSKKISQSRTIRSFLEACASLDVLPVDLPSVEELTVSQDAKRMKNLILKERYFDLLRN
ncbi:MAG: hypothetical protein KF836_01865 [Fimbriimonadaceae bacterium]|nr:hypothetical protein [Fimbriimonadaceae bacterium]